MDNLYITKTGSKNSIASYVSQETGIEHNIILNILNFLEKNQNLLTEGESINSEILMTPSNINCMSFITHDFEYSINLKVITIFILSVIIDNKLTLPVTSSILAIKGLKKAMTTINTFNGARCVLLEIMRNKTKSGDVNLFENNLSQCVNNSLECHCREDNSSCNCSKKNIQTILDQLEDDGVLKKINNSYHYSPWGFI